MEITIMGLILHLLAIWIWINPKIILGDASNHDEFINDNLGNQNNGGVSELEQEQTLNDLNDLGDDYDMNQFCP